MDNLQKTIHKRLHLGQRPDGQSKTTLYDRLASHVPNKDTFGAQAPLDSIAVSWRPDEEKIAPLPIVFYA